MVHRALTSLFAESEIQATKRSKMADDFGVKIADAIKEFNRERVVLTKKVISD
jgi:hypothetical protein